MKSMAAWVESINVAEIPVLRRTMQEFERLSGHAETLSAAEIATVVLHDPLMTLKILHLVNNMNRGRLNHEITTVEQAFIMAGVNLFFRHFSDVTMLEDKLPERAQAGVLPLMSRAHHAAWQARDWAIVHADLKAEEVYIGALLHSIGEMLLWCFAPVIALQIENVAKRKQVAAEEAQLEVLGFTLMDLQLALASAWNLPETLRMFMDDEAAVRPRIKEVGIATSIARRAATSWYDPGLLSDYTAFAASLHIHLDDAITMIHHNAVVEAKHWEWYGVPPSATWLPMLPGRWPESGN